MKDDNTCYAALGKISWHWREVTAGTRGDTWHGFCLKVAKFKDGQIWRHNQAGDLPGNNRVIDRYRLGLLVWANRGKKGFTYSHKPVLGDGKVEAENRSAIAMANRGGFTVNLSANNLDEADQLTDLGIAPVVAVVHSKSKGEKTPKGRKVVICPAQMREDRNCSNCGLCQLQDRKGIIVGFRAHGTRSKVLDARIQLS
jgi:hypothetical protein